LIIHDSRSALFAKRGGKALESSPPDGEISGIGCDNSPGIEKKLMFSSLMKLFLFYFWVPRQIVHQFFSSVTFIPLKKWTMQSIYVKGNI